MDALSSAELVQMALPMMPKSKQGVEYHAKKQAWPFVEAPGQARGGKLKKYLVSGLPAEIQAAIKEKQAAEWLVKSETLSTNLPAVAQSTEVVFYDPEVAAEAAKRLSGKQKKVAEARSAVCGAILHTHWEDGVSKQAAMADFLLRLQTGNLSAQMMRLVQTANDRSGKATVSVRTLKSWLREFQTASDTLDRLIRLAPKPTRVKRNAMDLEWLPYFQRFYALPSKPKMAHAYERFAAWWREARPYEPMPSESAVRRAWKMLPPIIQERGRSTGSELKKLASYVKRDWVTNLKPNDVWIIDGHSFKAQVRHPVHGQPFKPEITLVLDGNTRVVVGFSLGLAESAMEVMNAMRHGIADYGEPLVLYSDNGAGETANRLDDEVTGIFIRIGIRHETGIAGNPQGRGIIERWWKDNVIKLAQTYPTYRGNGMDSGVKNLTWRKQQSAFNALEKGRELSMEQQQFVNQVPTWAQFRADVARCIAAYNQRPHSELPMNPETGKRFTPLEFRAYQTARYQIEYERLTEHELKTLFMPMDTRTTRNGWLELFNNPYFNEALVAYHGQVVHVAYDMADAGYVMVYRADHTLICKAILNGNTRDAFAPSMLEREAEKRAQRKIKRAENVIRLAEAEKNPALEQANAFDELFAGGMDSGLHRNDVVAVSRTGTDDIVLFESDFED